MQSIISPNSLNQECLSKLQKILDLAMQTAEAASTEGNHKIVLQAVREVTRIITLMTKLAGAPAPEAATSIPAAPITTKTPVQADQKLGYRDADERPGPGRAQDFPRPGQQSGTCQPGTKNQNRLFWKREKGGKLPEIISLLII